jgi:hypothetical protein
MELENIHGGRKWIYETIHRLSQFYGTFNRKWGDRSGTGLWPAELCFIISAANIGPTELTSPIFHCFMAHIHASLMQQVQHVPNRHREPHMYHVPQADGFAARFEIFGWDAFCGEGRVG